MGSKTGVIKYNVTDRGRKFRGNDRNFDVPTLVAMVNSPAVQERVKMRDMNGYYGHMLRAKFGMTVPEVVIVDGKQVSIEPAFVTTMLKADEDGTIHHEAEFMDTQAGRVAERCFKSKYGGFSSAINSRRVGSLSVPVGFFGFDYVFEPNYTTNRGYEVQLDGVGAEESLFDEVAEYQQNMAGINAMFDAVQADFERQAQTLARLAQENEALLAMLSKQQGKKEVLLDSLDPFLYGGGQNRLQRAEAAFMGQSVLAGFEPRQKEDEAPEPGAEAKDMIRHRFGV